MKSWIRDIFITLLLLAVFSWAGLEFYKDLHSQISNEGGEVIGEITFIRNGAQRKFADRAIWGELETSAPLYNYDSLRTIEDSGAVIKLVDGTEITLAANTYIVLEWGEEAQNIEFLGGNISAERKGEGTSKLNIKAEDTIIALDTASVTLDKKEGEAINLSVDKGEIDVTVGEETRNIGENFRASIQDDIRVEQEAITLEAPANNKLLVTTAATVPVEFRWNQFLPLENLILEVAEQNDFRQAARLQPSPGLTSYTKDTLPGTYFWRIRGNYSDGTPYFSSASRLVLLRDTQPVLSVPNMDELFKYRKALPDLAFSWETSGLTNASRLQVARDPGFTDILSDINSSNNFYTLREVPAGEYFWRVIPQYNTASKISFVQSDIRRFQVIYNDTVDPPELLLPAEAEQVNPLKSKEGLRFSWKADKEISSYHLLVARDDKMTDPVVDQWLNRNSYLMNTLPTQGEYFWQVDGLDKDNQPVAPSAVRDFSVLAARIYVTPLKPAAESLLIVDSYDSTPFKWETSLEGPYDIQIFRDENLLVPLLKQVVFTPSATLPLPGKGNYYWQARVLDREGNVTIASEQVPFTMVDKLSRPEIIQPEEGDVQSIVGNNSLTISWQPVSGVGYYNAELIPKNTEYPSLSNRNTSETVWEITDKTELRAGKYTLKLQAFNQEDETHLNSSDPVERNFSLSQVQSYAEPILTYPLPGRNLSLLTIREQKPSFRWTQMPPLPNQQIRLSRDPNFATTILDEQLTVMNREIPDLETGTYYLQILSSDKQGNPAPPSLLYSFDVTPVPLLPLPKITEPVEAAVWDMQVRDALEFRWTPSAGADYYDLKLLRNDTGDLVFHQEEMATTQYTFNKLEDLDVGVYRVEVQALRELDGRVFQQSSVQARIFELTLPEITEIPEILSPELQYAH